jgi:hypothetical protein
VQLDSSVKSRWDPGCKLNQLFVAAWHKTSLVFLQVSEAAGWFRNQLALIAYFAVGQQVISRFYLSMPRSHHLTRPKRPCACRAFSGSGISRSPIFPLTAHRGVTPESSHGGFPAQRGSQSSGVSRKERFQKRSRSGCSASTRYGTVWAAAHAIAGFSHTCSLAHRSKWRRLRRAATTGPAGVPKRDRHRYTTARGMVLANRPTPTRTSPPTGGRCSLPHGSGRLSDLRAC